MVKSPNAYTYSNDTGGGVSGNVMTLSLNGAGGSSMSVSHSQEPFELWMDGKLAALSWHLSTSWQ